MDTEIILKILFYILLLDSLIANLIAWRGQDWYSVKLPSLSKYLPITKAWAGWYLILVIFIGVLIFFN